MIRTKPPQRPASVPSSTFRRETNAQPTTAEVLTVEPAAKHQTVVVHPLLDPLPPTGREFDYGIVEERNFPKEAFTLADELQLGAYSPMHREAAMARYVARFGAPRSPGIELVAFERGAVYRENGGHSWRPVPAEVPPGATFDAPGSYSPIEYCASSVKMEAEKAARGQSTWAHRNDLTSEQLAALVSKMRSHEGPIKTDVSGRPLNPLGPTGVSGRGESNLGPILAQDLLLTTSPPETGKTFAVLIKRKDTGRWALPGGIEDALDGSARLPTAVREFFEETKASLPGLNLENALLKAFEQRVDIYQGVCAREPRNTDNSWFETTVFHVQLPWSVMRQLQLDGSDDASDAALIELTNELIEGLHGDHPDFVKRAIKMESEPLSLKL